MSKILIVDDSLIIRTTMMACIKKTGREPLVAKDGQEAIEILEATDEIEAIFLDINMPNMDGFEMLKSLKTHEKLDQFFPPIVMLTTEKKDRFIESAKKLGVKAWLQKPTNYQQVSYLLEQLSKKEHT